MKIVVTHFRIGLTDGVSLQIDERIRILKELGYEVVTIAGSLSPIADLRIPHFEYKSNVDIVDLQKKIFVNGGDQFGAAALKWLHTELEKISLEIEKQLEQFWQKEKFSQIFIHNLFSLPVCIPASIAMYSFLQKHPEVRGVAVHHDFYWDPPRIKNFQLQTSNLKHLLEKYFPPILPNLIHTTISHWEQRELKKRRGIDSAVITDTYDFGMKPWTRNKTNTNYLSDIGVDESDFKILCASRIRPRKGIEIAIEFVHVINRQIQKSQFPNPPSRSSGSRAQSRDNFQSNLKFQKAILILPGEFGEKEKKYVDLLKKKAKKLKVDVRWIKDYIGSEEEVRLGLKKYSLWDTYVYCDAVIYPSLWEGFGNQFLEAVFARKPIVVFEYEVYNTDIKTEGFKTVSLGDRYKQDGDGLAKIPDNILSQASQELISIISDEARQKYIVEHNFLIGTKKFNTPVMLRRHLEKTLK